MDKYFAKNHKILTAIQTSELNCYPKVNSRMGTEIRYVVFEM